jgi:hypothetical protein
MPIQYYVSNDVFAGTCVACPFELCGECPYVPTLHGPSPRPKDPISTSKRTSLLKPFTDVYVHTYSASIQLTKNSASYPLQPFIAQTMP